MPTLKPNPSPSDIVLYLESEGYFMPKVLKDGRFVAILPQFFGGAIVQGPIEHVDVGWSEQWMFTSFAATLVAYDDWHGKAFKDEPDGWVRYLGHGIIRRRPSGDASKEYIDNDNDDTNDAQGESSG